MNSISLSHHDVANDAAPAEFVSAISRLTGFWTALSSWKVGESRRLAESVSLIGQSAPLNDWLDHFPSSLGASADAFCRFLDADLPDETILKRLRDALDAYRNGDYAYEEVLVDMNVDRVDAEGAL